MGIYYFIMSLMHNIVLKNNCIPFIPSLTIPPKDRTALYVTPGYYLPGAQRLIYLSDISALIFLPLTLVLFYQYLWIYFLAILYANIVFNMIF